MKVLVIHNFYTKLTGEDLTVRETTEALKDSEKVEVVEYYKYSGDFQKLSWLKKLTTLIKGNVPFYVPGDFREILDKERPDIAQIHNLIPFINIWILKELKRRNIPTIYFIHNYRIFCPRGTCFLKDRFCIRCFNKSLLSCVFYNCLGNFLYSLLYTYRFLLQRFFLGYIDTFLSRTNFTRKFYEKHLPNKNIAIAGVYVRIPKELEDSKQEKKDFVIFAGRLVREKGVLTVLESAGLLKDIKFKICGEGPLMDYCRTLAREKDLKNVELLGLVARHRLLGLIKASRVLVFGSSWPEVSPRMLLESMSLGTPVIAPKIGVIPEMVKNGDNGLLYEVNNARDLAEKIERLFEDVGLYEKISYNARNINLENTRENYLQRLLDVYNEI